MEKREKEDWEVGVDREKMEEKRDLGMGRMREGERI